MKHLLCGATGSTAAAQTVDNESAALDVLRKCISVDVHAYGGTTGIISQTLPNNDLGMWTGRLDRWLPQSNDVTALELVKSAVLGTSWSLPVFTNKRTISEPSGTSH